MAAVASEVFCLLCAVRRLAPLTRRKAPEQSTVTSPLSLEFSSSLRSSPALVCVRVCICVCSCVSLVSVYAWPHSWFILCSGGLPPPATYEMSVRFFSKGGSLSAATSALTCSAIARRWSGGTRLHNRGGGNRSERQNGREAQRRPTAKRKVLNDQSVYALTASPPLPLPFAETRRVAGAG